MCKAFVALYLDGATFAGDNDRQLERKKAVAMFFMCMDGCANRNIAFAFPSQDTMQMVVLVRVGVGIPHGTSARGSERRVIL